MSNASTRVVTGKVRFSFVHIAEPKALPGSEPKYSITLLIPKTDTTTVERIKAAMEAARLESAGKFNGKVPNSLKNTMHDGDGQTPSGDDYGPECKGHWVLSASSKSQPGVLGPDGNDMLDIKRELYSGCYGRASLNFYAYNTSGNKGIACGLNNLMKLADGEPLGGGARSARDDFNDGYIAPATDTDFTL